MTLTALRDWIRGNFPGAGFWFHIDAGEKRGGASYCMIEVDVSLEHRTIHAKGETPDVVRARLENELERFAVVTWPALDVESLFPPLSSRPPVGADLATNRRRFVMRQDRRS